MVGWWGGHLHDSPLVPRSSILAVRAELALRAGHLVQDPDDA